MRLPAQTDVNISLCDSIGRSKGKYISYGKIFIKICEGDCRTIRQGTSFSSFFFFLKSPILAAWLIDVRSLLINDDSDWKCVTQELNKQGFLIQKTLIERKNLKLKILNCYYLIKIGEFYGEKRGVYHSGSSCRGHSLPIS